jgi:hypothetical protein
MKSSAVPASLSYTTSWSSSIDTWSARMSEKVNVSCRGNAVAHECRTISAWQGIPYGMVTA